MNINKDNNLNLVPRSIVNNWKQSIAITKDLKIILIYFIMFSPPCIYMTYLLITHNYTQIQYDLKSSENHKYQLQEQTTYTEKSIQYVKNFNNKDLIINLFTTDVPNNIYYKKLVYQNFEMQIDAHLANYETVEIWTQWLHKQYPIKNFLITSCTEGAHNDINIGVQFTMHPTENL